MALLAPIIQCLVDQEPTSFHESDANGETFSFAVNLSLDCRGDGATSADIETEEKAAEDQFLNFLSDVQNVRFYLFSVAANRMLDYAGPVHATSGRSPARTPSVLHEWLKECKSTAIQGERYWSTESSSSNQHDVVIEANNATATHRLRAAQAWNAPVAHRFGLTHIVRVARDRIADKQYVVLPYFAKPDDPPAEPEFEANHADPIALDYSYDPLGRFGKAVCRTNPIGAGITDELDPAVIDRSLTSGGYLKINEDAENIRRTLVWLEERAATVMAANPALHSRAKNPDDDPSFEELFGIKVVTVKHIGQDGKSVDVLVPYWGSIVWYVIARLLSTLDNLMIALLKPVSIDNPTFDRGTEGELLAPLVTAMLAALRDIQQRFNLDEAAFQKDKVTAALRSGLAVSSLTAFGPAQSNAELVRALRHIYGIDAPTKDAVKNERDFISAILARYGDGGGAKIPDNAKSYAEGISGHSVQTLSRALLDLEQPLQEETGAEAAIVKIFESAGSRPALASVIASAYLREINNTASELQAAVEAAFNTAWSAYRTLLDGPFNGAEATRRATGHSFVRNILDLGITLTSLNLQDTAGYSAFFSRRFGVDEAQSPAKCFDPIVSALVIPARDTCVLTDKSALPAADFKPFLDEKIEQIREHLNAGFADAVMPLRSLNNTDARFIPDSSPQPLAIQVADNVDGSHIDEFAKHLNGIGVVIQRADKGATSDLWAYANLADLGWTQPSKKDGDGQAEEPLPDVKGAIHPMLPAVSDGRGPMFIEYQGFPFADRADDARTVANDAEPNQTRQRPFYRHDPHEAEDGFAKLPRLAYGRTFKTFAFITSNAGTLPLALQSAPDTPWMPKPAPQEPPPDRMNSSLIVVGKADYQRRTAISQMAVIENVGPNRMPRIGVEIAGAMPLATDYPRVGLQAEKNASGARDILREADGTGKMVADQNFEWQISNVEFAGAPERLTLRFFERPAKYPTDTGDATFEINETSVPGFATTSTIVIKVEFKSTTSGTVERWLSVKCGDTPIGQAQKLSDGTAMTGWLRFVLDAKAGKQASMAFANIGSQKADNVSEPLLLLAPKTAAWKDGLSDPVEITVSTPRVGYLDFDRWFGNPDLLKDMFFLPGDVADIARSVEMFEQALVAAYVMRHHDPVLNSFLDRLPDPAVEQVRIELARHDALIKADTGQLVVPQMLLLKSKPTGFGRTFFHPCRSDACERG